MNKFIPEEINKIPEIPGVYEIIQISTGKSYIGSSRNLRWRLTNHYREVGFQYSQLCTSDLSDLVFNIIEYCQSDIDQITLLSKEGYAIRNCINLMNMSPTGTGFDSGKGRVWMNDGIHNYRIYPEQVADHPELVIGFLGNYMKDRINITKEGIDKRVDQADLDNYLNEGWSLGREFAPTNKGLKGMKVYMNNGVKDIHITCTWYKYWKSKGYKVGKLSDKYPFVNNGKTEMSIYEWEVAEYLNKGWKLGHLIESID